LGYDQHLRPEFIKMKNATADMMEEVYQDLIPYINRTEFPHFILPKIRALGCNGMWFKDHGGSGLNNLEAGLIFYEMAKRDGSVSMFTLV
jgi:alkylation response protein AidB-like acyl-CoA dehydrogenase